MKNNIVKTIAIITFLVGVMVIVGWILDITVLTSILPQWIRMKIATAICFVFSGIILFYMSYPKEELKDIGKIALTIFAMLITLIMGTLFLGSIFGFQTGMENIAFVDIHEVKTPIFQGRPSVATMICFILIAAAALLYAYKNSYHKYISSFGWVVCLMGFLGVIGYLVNNHYLFYEIPGISNAIAIHTTFLFGLIGSGLVLLGKRS